MSVTTNTLANLDKARHMLAASRTLPEVKRIRDIAEAAKAYAKAARLGRESQNYAAEISLLASCKAGEILSQLEKSKGGDAKHAAASVAGASEYARTLEETQTPECTARYWQKLAEIPEDERTAYVAEIKANGGEITAAGVLKPFQKARRQKEQESKRAAITNDNTFKPPESQQYTVLLADCPWRYDFAETDNRKIENHYGTLSVEEICNFQVEFEGGLKRKVSEVAAPDAVLFLWATAPKLREALQVMAAWGFEYKTNAVWDKEKIGMGYWFRGQHEHLLVGTRGKISPPEAANRAPSIIRAPRAQHSTKPTKIYEIIEAMYPIAARAEIFAGNEREGWVSFGNQIRNKTNMGGNDPLPLEDAA